MDKKQIKKMQEYRKYPDKFIEDIFGCKLPLWQRIYIRNCNKFNKWKGRSI